MLAAYVTALDAGLVLDARPLITDNPGLRAVTSANVRRLVTSDYWAPLGTDGLYRPAASLSYLFNYAVLGNDARPLGYHVVNLLLHLACTGLVFVLVERLTDRRLAAVLAAALFGLHPIATEAVTNVAGRPDLLATLGVLGALVCHAHLTADDARRRAAWASGLLVASTLAVFAKESGLVVLAALVLYDAVCRRRLRPRAAHLLPLLATIGYLAARWSVARAGLPPDDVSPVDNPIVEAGFVAGRATGLKALGRELLLLAWPRTLSADYSFAELPVVRLPPHGWEDCQAAAALLAVGLLVAAAWRVRRTSPALGFFGLLAVLALLPTANLLVVIGSVMAERFLYLPMVGVAGAVGLLVAPAAKGRTWVLGIAALVLVALGVRTAVRNRDWRDEASLWASAVDAAPASAKAHKGYAEVLFAADPSHQDLARVIAEAERAVEIRADYLPALIDLGSYRLVAADRLAARGSPDATAIYAAAVAALERARDLDAQANHGFAEKMVATGHSGRGIPRIGNIEVYQNLTLAYLGAGRAADGLAAAREACRLRPNDVSRYLDVSAVLARLERWEEAAVVLF